MEREYNFQIGQRVKIFDVDDKEWVYGEVTDKTSISVFVRWDDLSEPSEHFQDEYMDIKLDKGYTK